MKNLFVALFVTIVLFGCEVNSNNDINKSVETEMKLDESGLVCDDIYLEIDGKKVDRTHFSYGEQVYFSFNDVEGFKRKNDKFYPGLAVEIINSKTGDIVLENEDLFLETTGFSESVILLYSNVTVAFPHKNNETYKIEINIWDKKGDGKMNFEMPFTVNENEDFKVKTKDLTYDAMYFWNGTTDKFVANDKINEDHQLFLIFEGLKGFTAEDNLVYPSLSLQIVDNDGETIIDEANLFSEYTENGMKVEEFNEQVYIDVKFFDDKYANPLSFKTVLKDKKSGSKLQMETEIDVH